MNELRRVTLKAANSKLIFLFYLCIHKLCGTIREHLKKTGTDSQMKFYKVVARPTLLYGSETWVTTERDVTRLEAAEMRFLRSVKGYTRLDKIRSEVI